MKLNRESADGGLDLDEQSGAGLDTGPISHGGVGSTSFFGFFGKGLKMAMLDGDAAEEVAADPKALVPALLIYTLPSVLAGLIIALLVTAFDWAAPDEAGSAVRHMRYFPSLVQNFSLSFIVLPLVALVGSLICVGIFHLLAKLFKGQGGFIDYYQTIGVGSLIHWGGIIPYFGILFSLWTIPVTVVITSRVHNLSTGRSAAVVLIPVTIVVVLVIAFFSAMIMAAMGAAGAGGM